MKRRKIRERDLSQNDRRELRTFKKFLSDSDKKLPAMMTEEKWQKYLAVTPKEAWLYAKDRAAQRRRTGRG